MEACLHKHYNRMFGFLILNDEHLTKYPQAAEHIWQALQWLQNNNDLFKKFLSHYETIYQYFRPHIVNSEVLQLNDDRILDDQTMGMAFLLTQLTLTNIAALYDTDVAGIQHPQPSVQDHVKQIHELTNVSSIC